MNNTDLTVVYFDCGNYSKEDNKMVWISQNDKIRTLAMKTPINDVSYIEMVSGIGRKLGIADEATTKLQMSYIPFIFNREEPIYIQDDDEVLGYLTNYKDQCRSVLHVQVLQNDCDEDNRDCCSVREEDAEANNAALVLYEGEPAGSVGNRNANEEVDVECEGYLDCLPTTDNGVCVGGEWDDGLDITLQQEFGTKEVVYDIIQKASHKNYFEFLVIK